MLEQSVTWSVMLTQEPSDGGNDDDGGGRDALWDAGGIDNDWLLGLLAGRRTLRGDGGFDWAISTADDDEREEGERWFDSVDEFVAALR